MNRHWPIRLTLAAALLLGVTACQKDGAPDGSPSGTDVVTFKASAVDATRTTTVAAGAFSQSETFRVYATKRQDDTTTEYIADDGSSNIVSYGLVYPDAPYYDTYYGLTAWHTAGGYTWTSDYTYNFYAVWPATAPTISHTSDYQTITIDYTGSNPIDGTTDLLIAISENAEKNSYGIPLTFRHALCSVTFTAVAENGVTFTINSIQLQGIQDRGTFNFTSASWTADSPTTPTTTTYDVTVGNALLLMPQSMTEDAQIVVSYKVLSADGTTYLRGTADSWAEKTIPLSGSTWTVSKRLTYTLTANEDLTLSVTEIVPWESTTGDSKDIEI